MRRSRTIHAALALVVMAAPAAMATSAYAAEPLPPDTIALTQCDIAAQAAGTTVKVATAGTDLTTGRDNGTGAVITAGQRDDTWRVPANPPDNRAFSITKHAAWMTPVAGNWVNSRADYNSTGTGGPLATRTTFRATFDVPRQSFLNRLDLMFAADNGATFFLNGVPIGGFDPVVADVAAFQREHPLVYAGPLIREGRNVLEAQVTDYGVATGLLVRGGYQGCAVTWIEPGICVEIGDAAVYTYAPRPIDLATGSDDGIPYAPGLIDDEWTTPTTLSGHVYAVAPYSTAWYGGSTTASWVHVSDDVRTSSLGTYRYRIEFTVGNGATYQDLDLRWAADNDVAFLLNGVPIGGGSGAVTSNFNTLHPLHWNGVFVAGTNVLEAVVTDYGVASGLLVEGGARVCYDDRAATVGEIVENVRHTLS